MIYHRWLKFIFCLNVESVALPNRKHNFLAKKYQWSTQGENATVSQSITGTKLFQFDEDWSKQRWHGRLDSPQVHTPERCLSIQNITLNADTHHPKITRREIKENAQHPWSEKHCIGSNCIQVSRTKRKSREMWHIIGVDILRAVSDDKIVFTNASRCYKSWPLAKNFCLDARGRE